MSRIAFILPACNVLKGEVSHTRHFARRACRIRLRPIDHGTAGELQIRCLRSESPCRPASDAAQSPRSTAAYTGPARYGPQAVGLQAQLFRVPPPPSASARAAKSPGARTSAESLPQPASAARSPAERRNGLPTPRAHRPARSIRFRTGDALIHPQPLDSLPRCSWSSMRSEMPRLTTSYIRPLVLLPSPFNSARRPPSSIVVTSRSRSPSRYARPLPTQHVARAAQLQIERRQF